MNEVPAEPEGYLLNEALASELGGDRVVPFTVCTVVASDESLRSDRRGKAESAHCDKTGKATSGHVSKPHPPLRPFSPG